MTKWGKFLRFFGLVDRQELELMLCRVLGFRAERRNWETRFKRESEWGTFEGITDLWCEELRRKFLQTRLAKVHGWRIGVGDSTSSPEYIFIRLASSTVDVEHLFKIWVYDVDAFLAACNGKVGLNLDDANWFLKNVMSTAKARKETTK